MKNPAYVASVIQLGDRYFCGYKKGRCQTAWALCGAKFYAPRVDFMKADIERLQKHPRHQKHIVIVTFSTEYPYDSEVI